MSGAGSADLPFSMTVDESCIIRLVQGPGDADQGIGARTAMVMADELCHPTPRPLFVDMGTVSVDRPAVWLKAGLDGG